MDAFWLLPILAYGECVSKWETLSKDMEVGGTCWTYSISEENMTYADAETWCKTRHAHLIAIQNKNESEQLNLELPPNVGHYWIGIRKIDNEWRWVATNTSLTEEAENWAQGEPNNKQENEDCVEIYIKRKHDAGKWNDDSCTKKKAALCCKASCKPHSCSGHGECIETFDNYTCHCDRGFYGRDCENATTCDPLKEPDQGTMKCNHPVEDFSYNSSCQVQCIEGYRSTGLGPVLCTDSGNWSGPIPVCKVVECGELQAPTHGLLTCSHPSGNFAWNSSCEFACEEGFLLKGSSRLQCDASGEWDRQKPECEAVKCEVVRPVLFFQPERSFVNCSHAEAELTYGSTCNFGCEEGYSLRGSSQIQCSSSGYWSESTPFCEASGNTASVISIGVAATGASFLSVVFLLIWLLKHLRRKAKKFIPARYVVFQNLNRKFKVIFADKKLSRDTVIYQLF
ncbi:E-selectin-like [Tiliqua scincoides]|uniref:E-selectin-like n=1 Tax=Tiliqua scincoides TaxID=71010 RepID=UPI0034635726